MRRTKSLGELVHEIERFFHERGRNVRNNYNDMAEECTIREYATPSTDEPHIVIVYLAVMQIILKSNLHFSI